MRRLDPLRIRRDVGRKIAELRTERGLTQAQAAELAGVTLKFWQRREAGTNITVDSLVTLANLFGVPLSAFFDSPLSRAVRRGRPKGE